MAGFDDLSDEEMTRELTRRKRERKKASEGLRMTILEGESAARALANMGISMTPKAGSDEEEDELEDEEPARGPRRGFFGGAGLGDQAS